MRNSRWAITPSRLLWSYDVFPLLCFESVWHSLVLKTLFRNEYYILWHWLFHIVRENLKVAQSWQKHYADNRRRDLAFEVGDFVYLKGSPMGGLHRFKVKGKMSPRYVWPFKVLDHRGEVAYQLELWPQHADVHNVFHVSQLKKCLRVPEEQLPIEELDLQEDLTYTEWPIKILETTERVTPRWIIW
jgi:hypothetical protein